FVSIPAWAAMLRQISPTARPAEWLPIPSTVPAVADPSRVADVRGRIAPAGGTVIGHFGTFGTKIANLIVRPLAELLRHSANRVVLLVGRNSPTFRDRFAGEHPDLVGRVTATGEVGLAEVAAHLSACDLLLQPFVDGASCRRTSLMSGLALGV